MKRVLITGGCGFIGHHVVEHILKNTDWDVDILDHLNYASIGMERLKDISVIDWKRVRVFTCSLELPINEGVERTLGEPDYLLHLAATTHVDNSIRDPLSFVRSNVVGTAHILEWARRRKRLEKMLYMSTDEVFGPAPFGVNFKEWHAYNSTNPYSASKAAGEELCLAWANAYKVPVVIAHGMNAFGERQHPEKFIPKVIGKVLAGEKVTIHASKDKLMSGSRFWIHARNMASALLFLLDRGEVRDKYNIVGECEVTNLDMAIIIADILSRQLKYEMVDFHSSRPGHDLRYALDGTKMREMGWKIPIGFKDSLEKTVRWTVAPENREWFEQSYAAT